MSSSLSGQKRTRPDATSSGGFKVPSLPSEASKRANVERAEHEPEAERGGDSALEAGDVKRLLTQLERAFLRNAEQRASHGDEPRLFLESELALHDAIEALEAVASHPRLFGLLVVANTAESLTALLAHENSDIANDAVRLLAELTDADVVLEAEADTRPFVEALLQRDLLALLVAHLARLLAVADVAQESEVSAVFDAFGILENLIEVAPDFVCRSLVERAEFVPLLLKQLAGQAAALTGAQSSATRTRLYAAELLSIVLQQAPVGALIGCVTPETVDALLTALAMFRKEPKRYDGSEGPELAANLFNALCSLLLRGGAVARRLVRAADGLQLLLILARPIASDAGDKFKRSDDVRLASVRALEYAVMGSLDACNSLVDLQGIGTLAKYIVGSDSMKPKQRHVLTLRATMTVAALLRQLGQIDENDDDDDDGDIGDDAAAAKQQERENSLTRVLTKLLEPDKLGALIQLHDSLYNAVSAADREVALAMRVKSLNGEDITDAQEDEWYSMRLDAGLFELQQTDLVLALIATRFKPVVVAALHAAQTDPTLLAEILKQYAQSAADELREAAGIDLDDENDGDDDEAARALEERITAIADAFSAAN
jgi:beta-catenin-like protein 1